MKLSLFKEKDSFSFSALMNFKRYRDFEGGVIECKDGALMAGFSYKGVDSQSSSVEELNYISYKLNSLLKEFDSGWCLWSDIVRMTTNAYIDTDKSYFNNDVSAMIDHEREAAVLEQEDHYESVLFFVLMYKSPSRALLKLADAMVDNDQEDDDDDARKIKKLEYNEFTRGTDRFFSDMPVQFQFSRLLPYKDGSGEWFCDFARYLNFCATGINRLVSVPSPDIPLDSLIVGQDFYPRITPIVGQNRIAVLSIVGLPKLSEPALFGFMDYLPLNYRWSTRYIFMDNAVSLEKMRSARRKWSQKIKSLKDQILNNQSGTHDQDAVNMVVDSDAAISETSSGEVANGYYTSVVVIYAENDEELESCVRYLAQEISKSGSGTRRETVNATEAFLGTVPGNVYPNIARDPISTMVLADILPVSSQWSGHEFCPSDFFPEESPPLMQCETVGSTPFRMSLHVRDVGHSFVAGPTGTGKSTLLALLAAQWGRYQNARVISFDVGMSIFPLTMGVGGSHHEIGSDEHPVTFMPLADIDSYSGASRAQQWVELCLSLVGFEVTPSARSKIWDAIILLRESDMRTVTEFCSSVQDEEIREAMKFYTISGAAGHILDQESETGDFGQFTTFEVSDLMEMGEKIILPVLHYLFNKIEDQLDGSPIMIILDEVWLLFEHPLFLAMIKKWLKTLRKRNALVIMATQSLSDAKSSGMMDVIMESCPTKILLPHPSVAKETHRDFYSKSLGLNDRELFLLSHGTPKREYYYTSPDGKRLFQLNLRPKTLAWVGNSKPQDIERIRQLMKDYPDEWRDLWLKEAA